METISLAIPSISVSSGQTSRQTLKNRKIQSKHDVIIKWLQTFYNQPGRINRIVPILTSASPPISLRLIEWFVTNYAKKFNTSYMLDGIQFIVHFYYKRELKAYSKKLFDPFCRRERISFQIHDYPPIPETTVGQLNFFRWALDKGVIDYILAHTDEIVADMTSSLKEHYSKNPDDKTPTGRRKRKEMSHSASKPVNYYKQSVTVSFD